MKKILKWAAVSVAALFVLAQFIRPARTNPAVDQARTIQARSQVPPAVSAILSRSCNDCHSNETRWPWYTNIAPVSWFIVGHVNDGREDMNLSDWAQYSPDEQAHYLKKMCQEVKHGDMPLHSYLWLHGDAKLSDQDVQTLCDWAARESERMAQAGK